MSVFEQRIPITKLKCSPQVRTDFDEQELRQLAASLTEMGQLYPLRVRADGDGYVVEDGGRRVRAAQIAGLETLDAIVVEGGDEEAQRITRQLVTNCQRAALNSSETARAIEDLIRATNWTESEVAKRLGFSPAKVSRLLSLLTLPGDLLAMIDRGLISASAGYELAKVTNPEQRAALAKLVAEEKLTRDSLAARVKRLAAPPSESSDDAEKQRVTAALGGGRSITLAGPGLVSIDAVLNWLGELVAEARKVRAQNLELSTFVRMLRDRAKA